MNLFGIGLGLATRVIIGLGFVWVVRGGYSFGYLGWPYVMGGGVRLLGAARLVSSDWPSALLGVAGGCIMGGSTKRKRQAARGELGWYPPNSNPKPQPLFAEQIKKWRVPHL